jgi:hypothetical protein
MKNKFCTLVNIIIANPTQVDLFFNHVQFKDSQHQRQLKQMKEVIVINITLINSSLGQLKSLTIYTNKQMFSSMNEAKRIKGPSPFNPCYYVYQRIYMALQTNVNILKNQTIEGENVTSQLAPLQDPSAIPTTDLQADDR